ncbi:hypothetical protein [Microbacterium jiangjiandongii]|uniref:hypothetical protein n=1 Tax=Microbacterium jiangjiandongii TaxID=3049071 RepID=UPI00214C9FCB|nr:hypothetical protein [Microbacterium sp. zg.Y843]MCR2814999.1 hypothetical protein [Microbacterium sp. zg.Y843]
MSTETTTPAQPAAGSTGLPSAPKKKVPWWVWALIGVVALALVIGVVWFATQGADDDADDAGVGPAPAAVEEDEPEEDADAPVEREEFTGTGDMVVPVAIDKAALVSFTCEDCTSNVLVTSDAEEGLIANSIGAYTGSRLVNMAEGSAVTEITVEADGTWELVVDDVENAPSFDGAVTGTGDQAFWMTGEFESVAFVNGDQRGNHAVWAYRNGMTNPLIFNGIGPADDTAEMTGPALVQVSSRAEWTLTPQ